MLQTDVESARPFKRRPVPKPRPVKKRFGSITLIGGRESKTGKMEVLKSVAQGVKGNSLGIDEDTACVFDSPSHFEVIGAECVYIIDGSGALDRNVLKTDHEHARPFYNLRLHVLSAGSRFDVKRRLPKV